MTKEYKKGVYRNTSDLQEVYTDVLVFNGEEWFRPGYDCAQRIGDQEGHTIITESQIGELLWEWTPPKAK